APEYPEGETVGARVELVVTVDATGKVSGVTISQSAGRAFDAAALAAVARWTFQPATKNGTAMAAKIRVAIEFDTPAPATSLPDSASTKLPIPGQPAAPTSTESTAPAGTVANQEDV